MCARETCLHNAKRETWHITHHKTKPNLLLDKPETMARRRPGCFTENYMPASQFTSCPRKAFLHFALRERPCHPRVKLHEKQLRLIHIDPYRTTPYSPYLYTHFLLPTHTSTTCMHAGRSAGTVSLDRIQPTGIAHK